jgi:hypothetical protein
MNHKQVQAVLMRLLKVIIHAQRNNTVNFFDQKRLTDAWQALNSILTASYPPEQVKSSAAELPF